MKLVKALAILLVPLLLTSFLTVMPAAYASKPFTISGICNTLITDNPFGFKLVGDNLFYSEDRTGAYYGDLAGDFVGTASNVIHGFVDWTHFRSARSHQIQTFASATVNGKTGGLTLLFDADVWAVNDVYGYSAKVTILSGTGGLANLHGQGIAWSPAVFGELEYYQLQVHFDP